MAHDFCIFDFKNLSFKKKKEQVKKIQKLKPKKKKKKKFFGKRNEHTF